MAKRELTINEVAAAIRDHWRNTGTSGSQCVLVRPGSHGFIETNEAEIADCAEVVAFHGLTGEKFNALEKLGFRLLCEGMGLDPYTGKYKY